MNKARAKRLKAHCHEQWIRMNQARKDGKLIPDLHVVEDIYKILEEVLDHLEYDTIHEFDTIQIPKAHKL